MNKANIQKFQNLLQNFSESEQLDLIAYVASNLKKKTKSHTPLNLANFIAGKVDPNFDIDKALKEIRGEWIREWQGNGFDE